MISKENEKGNETNPNEEYSELGVKKGNGKEQEKGGESANKEGNKESTEEANKRKTSLNSQHVLNSAWSFWYISRKEKVHNVPYEDRLKKIATFSTLEDFFKYYVYLKPASEVERNSDLSLFKEGHKPLWECCPEGGCWFVRYKKSEDPFEVDLKWEKLLFALIGEQFDEPHMLGAVLSIRGRETIIELWFNHLKNLSLKAIIGEKMKDLLSIDNATVLYFKDNEKSIQDRSTLRNAETYNANVNYNKRKNTYY